jgi:flagellar P-ring protein precursor FlgI
MKKLTISCLILMLTASVFGTTVRIKDIAKFQSENTIPLIGYGLVVGLDGTGDSRSTQFTIQSLVNMMERMGVTVEKNQVKVKNVAAVMVTGELSPFMTAGARIDVTVSSMGDASSLQGGTLLITPLADPAGNVYASAQGPISIGGFNISSGQGDKFINNYTLVGRVPNGAIIEKQPPVTQQLSSVKLRLQTPDFTTANRLAEAIIAKFPNSGAAAMDEANVHVNLPDTIQSSGDVVKFLASIENLEIVPDVPARVVINEKTGTIVAGEHVTISSVMLAHGNLNIEIKATPLVSQPEPFSQGNTVLTRDSQVSVQPESARIIYMEQQANIGDLSKALNEIGASPRDIIAIFQALRTAGALRAELVIM